jgi:hypothetical protein
VAPNGHAQAANHWCARGLSVSAGSGENLTKLVGSHKGGAPINLHQIYRLGDDFDRASRAYY